MVSYKVTEKMFIDGKMYSPSHPRRNVYHRKTAFANGKLPKGLAPIKAETAAVKKKRTAKEKANAKAVAESKKQVDQVITFDNVATEATTTVL